MLTEEPESKAARLQLERVLASTGFARSERLSRLMYALNGGVLEYAKLTEASTPRGNRITPAIFREWVMSVGSGPVFSNQLSRLNPEPALLPLLEFVPLSLEYAYEPRT